jgi:CRISPR/Cas system-associated exonuclease Cas4 (RecB family)
MMSSEHESIWSITVPDIWPKPPSAMTVSTLHEIEDCPRRWALKNAQYSGLWSGHGYPSQINLRMLSGTVVHLTIENIVRELALAGCNSVQDPASFKEMKRLGGYTKIVNASIDSVLDRLTLNPRAKRLLEQTARYLRAEVPELRRQVQTMLCNVRLPKVVASNTRDYKTRYRKTNVRTPLTSGIFSEIELRANKIGWVGKADLLVLSNNGNKIIEFKTGNPDERHKFQIQIYALLWSRDTDLNPYRSNIDELVLLYNSSKVRVHAPNISELNALEHEIVVRSDAAFQAVSHQPPEARPNPDICIYCNVRHICDEYWTEDTQKIISQASGDIHFSDIEVTIIGQHGPSSWDAVIERSPIAISGQAIIIRSDNPPFKFHRGQTLRLLSVHVSKSDESITENGTSIIVATIGVGSEAFMMTE